MLIHIKLLVRDFHKNIFLDRGKEFPKFKDVLSVNHIW